MKLTSTHIAGIIDIIFIALFYGAFFVLKTDSEGFGYSIFLFGLFVSALAIVSFAVFSFIAIGIKHNKTNLLFWLAHIVNVIWFVTIIIGIKSIKIMGSPLF